jgi:ABC-type sugar transport system ATPase subunit
MSSLDAELKTDLMAELKKLQGALDATTVYITHDRVEALALAQRVALMKNGRISQIAAAHESRGATAIGEPAFD